MPGVFRRPAHGPGRILHQVFHPAALAAHEVIVRAHRGIVVQGTCAEMRGADPPLLDQALEVSVDGAEADRRQDAPDALVDELRRRVLGPRVPDDVEHELELRRAATTLAGPLSHRARTAGPPRPRSDRSGPTPGSGARPPGAACGTDRLDGRWRWRAGHRRPRGPPLVRLGRSR